MNENDKTALRVLEEQKEAEGITIDELMMEEEGGFGWMRMGEELFIVRKIPGGVQQHGEDWVWFMNEYGYLFNEDGTVPENVPWG